MEPGQGLAEAPDAFLYVLSAQPLMMALLGRLVELWLLGLLANCAQGFFQECRSPFTIRSLEAHSVNLDLALGGDDDFDGSFHRVDFAF